ncbi:FecR family protein [Sphingobium sp. AP50]|uniref:FecR family protein n=1 Tax=Sphingobium sp. AP50 TaxID=1884369 RepID=UPI0008D7F59B|nr:FecR domain-containing protein [Sphingobium sp. AP50]SEJ73537.1 FecR family protein [Sphingobium sp. AP50]
MSERESAEAIEEAAIAWVARVDSSPDDPETLAALEAWQSQDPRREGAYFRASAAWAGLDRARVLPSSNDDVEAPPVKHRASLGRRSLMAGALALALGSVVLGFSSWRSSSKEIVTALGEVRRMPLSDGSLAVVNTDSSINVRLRSTGRDVALDRGEAWFQVAKDKERPFVVSAGDVRVRAVGTAFSVRKTMDGADIQVTEGTVQIWSVANPAVRRSVSAGSRLYAGNRAGPGAATKSVHDIDRSLSWRTGQLVFEGETLGSAVAEFNRYNATQIRIEDSSLASGRFVGSFRTNEPEAFAKAAAALLGARTYESNGEIILTRP